MKKYYWLKRRKPAARLISDYSNSNDLQDRYASMPPIRFVDPSSDFVGVEVKEVEKETVKVSIDCVVGIRGMGSTVVAGNLSVVSGNEPTDALKNKKTCIHQRFIAPAGDMGHDPKYGEWINPYEGRWGEGRPKKKKTYEYY